MLKMNNTRDAVISFGITANESRKKRDDQTLTLRKKRRNDYLSKRRQNSHIKINSQEIQELFLQVGKNLELLYSHNNDDVLKAIECIRKISTKENNPPINEIIELGCIPRVIECLYIDREDIQYQSLWLLTNIASGSHDDTRVIVQYDIIPKVIEFFQSSNHKIRGQACWLLGNIAGDCAEFRDGLLKYDSLNHVLNLLKDEKIIYVIKIAIWTLSNLCRHYPYPPLSDLKNVFELISNLNINDRDIYIDKLWTLSFLMDASDECRSMLVESNLIYVVMSFLDNPDLSLLAPSLRILEVIIRNHKIGLQKAIEIKIPYYLKYLLTVDNVDLRKDGCRLLSILIESDSGIRELILQDEEIALILQKRISQDFFEVKIEALTCITSWIFSETFDVAPFINFIPSLLTLLNIGDNVLITRILAILLRLLKVSEARKDCGYNIVADCIFENEGVEILEKLINWTNNETIYKQISEILVFCENCFEEIIID